MRAAGIRNLAFLIVIAGCEGRAGSVTGLARLPGSSSGGDAPLNVSVQVRNYEFSPTAARVRQGGIVTWIWNSDTVSHNVTFSNDTYRGSATQSTGVHSVLFSTPGQFDYRCTIHIGMNGSVTVQ